MSSPSASLPGSAVIDLEIDSEVEEIIVDEDSSEGSSSKEDVMDITEAEAEESRLISQKYEIVDYEDLAEQHKNTGNEEYKMKRYDSAIRSYTEAINLCNEIPAYYGNRAACYIMVGNYKAALRDAKQSVAIDDKFEKGYMRMAKCSLMLGDVIAAEQAIKKYEALDASGTLVKHETASVKLLRELNEKAAASYDRQDYRTCVYHCDSAIKIASESIHHKLMRAECLALLDRFQEAEDIAIDIMKLHPTNVDAIYVRGLALYYSDNLDKGLQHFERTLQLDPDHKKAKSLLKKAKQLKEKKEMGNELFKMGKFREALAIYTEALQLDPLNKDINSKLYYNRSLVNAKLGNVREAIVDCTGALKNFEKYTKALVQRAKLHYRMENFEECVNDYEAAAKLERTPEIRNLLKDAKFQLKKSKRKDYYKILGITKQATDDEIKKAYRKRALVHHPDRHANSSDLEKKEQEKKFKEVGEAYTVLSDPVKKSRYDSGQDIEDLGPTPFDDQQVFQQFFSFPGDGGYSRFNGGTTNFTFQFK